MTGLANDLNIKDAGYVVHDGAGVFSGRTFQAGTGITLTNASGVAGNTTIATTASLTDLHAPRFIVASSTAGTGANFTSIQAAVNAAQGTGINSTVFIQPGTYTENIILPSGISLTGFVCDGLTNVLINGKISCSASNANNQNIISNMILNTNGDYCLEVTGANTCLVKVVGCQISCPNHDGISCTNANGSILFKECIGSSNTGFKIFNVTNTNTTQPNGGLVFFDCFLDNTDPKSSTASTISAGVLRIFNTQFRSPITTSGTANLIVSNSTLNCQDINTTPLTVGGSGGNDIYNSNLIAGSAVGLSISQAVFVQNVEIKSTNTNAISGTGTLNYSCINFRDTSSTIASSVQVPLVVSNDAVKITTPGAYPYTTVPQDAVILVDTSAARTITPLASPTTGQRHIIKDNVGTAAANNITVTPSGKNIDGAASYVITTNYGSITIIFNGTQWNKT